jgi:hypothetical protein
MVNAGVLGVVLVVVIMASGFGSYYLTSMPLNAEVSSYQSKISNLQSSISSISANPSTTTIYSTETENTTTTSISITTSTLTEYPIPNNVTFFVVYLSGCGNQGNYQISVNGQTIANGVIQSGTNVSIPISQLYQGDNVSISIGVGSYYFTCTSNEQGYLLNNGNQVGNAEDISNNNQQASALITWTA